MRNLNDTFGPYYSENNFALRDYEETIEMCKIIDGFGGQLDLFPVIKNLTENCEYCGVSDEEIPLYYYSTLRYWEIKKHISCSRCLSQGNGAA